MDAVCLDCSRKVARHGARCKSCAARERWRIARATGAKYGAKYPAAICKRCGKSFPHGLKGRLAYCSPECRSNRVIKTCIGCQREFSVPVSNAERYAYCSRKCSSEHRGVAAVCKRCGQPFRYSQTAPRRSHCSEACRRPPVLIACAHCASEFRIVPSRGGRRRYCSLRCYRASDCETSIERMVREQLDRLRLRYRAQAQIGPWVVDFLVGGLVIEADGSYWHSLRPDVDRRKNADLRKRGLRVWRLPEFSIEHPEFSELFETRLAHYEIAVAELPRGAPDEAVARRGQNGVIRRQRKHAAASVDADQLLLNV